MDLIPITKIKTSQKEWLSTRIKYDNDLCIQDIIEIMCNKSYTWLSSKKDFEIIIDYDSFKTEFINLIYNKYCHE